ncbi:hypothetical protein E2K93_11245 [Thalassotalea sp. HSM 43]|uniref:TorF family putative porin n=1 Tax=Thalassotalea sp. HSM 43 TaxID=2552945 RepID=UPI0010820909|nr:TorF family putative porin [Thalassotalea sp. HSM 43]QBY04922.1 hypothetical protein E2K93_11245 [Thalassotalea sp. HSM 43]
MKTGIKLLMGAALLTGAATQAAEVSTTISATDDYRFRGISQSAGDAALQGSLDVAFDNGVYVGAWASNIDFGGDGDTEVDYYIGYYTDITDDLGIDVSYSYYTYPGLDYDSDYGEIATTLFYKDFSIQMAYSDDFANTDESATYVAIDYQKVVIEELGFAQNIAIELHAGHSSGDYWDEYDIGSYSDYSVGVATDIKGFNFKVAYMVNDIDDEDEIGSNSAFRNDNAINFSVSKTFSLGTF